MSYQGKWLGHFDGDWLGRLWTAPGLDVRVSFVEFDTAAPVTQPLDVRVSFVEFDTVASVATVAEPARPPSSAAGAYYDTGRGYVKKDHGWVRVTKVARSGARAMPVAVAPASGAKLGRASAGRLALPVSVAVTARTLAGLARGGAKARGTDYIPSVGVALKRVGTRSGTRPLCVDTLQLDEILMMIEEMR